MSPTHELDSFREFFASCREMLFIARRDGVLLSMSAPLRSLLGVGAGEDEELSSYVHPDDHDAFHVAWGRLSEGACPVELSFRLRQADGEHRRVTCHVTSSPARGEVYGSLREDAAERGQSTEDLERRAEILRLLQENLPIGIWMIDRSSTFVHHEGQGLERIHLKQRQFLGLTMHQIVGGRPFPEEVIRAQKGELVHVIRDVLSTPWEHWYIPVRDEQGQVASILGIALDVSDAKRAERELAGKLELIQRQEQAIRALTTPIIEVWDRVLALPMLGVVDSARTAEATESLLAEISRKRARFAILDLTGVDAMDTGTAGHLVKLIRSIRLLGAEGVVTGIQPSVAQTMAVMGLDLEGIATFGGLRGGLQHCIAWLRKIGA